ncbi:MAG: flagellar M-ring protein FliF [Sulfuricella sp.]|nr:flagellar M-ring protein FliF [Sulfuricella sp.]
MALAPQQEWIARLQERFSQLSNNQKLGIMFGVAAFIALVIGASIWWTQPPEYRVLYSNISDRDGGPIIASLQQMNVPYKMAEGGGAILVPAAQVYELRLRLAAQGLPKGSVVGYELMDNQKLGISQFGEQANYHRALEGELTRTIQTISSIQAARVHLAFPKPSVFVREQLKPTASVLLTLHQGRALDNAQVNGMVYLISSSVPDLPVKNVTIVDQNGNLLSGPQEGTAQTGLNPTQLEYLRQVEQGLVKRIEEILAPIVGADNVRARVTADIDFSQAEQTEEAFKPNATPEEAAIRSQQSAETTGAGGQAAAGVPGALSNQPPGAASAPVTTAAGVPAAAPVGGASGTSHKESTINYEVGKTVKVVRQQVGGIRRLSAAVVVNHRKVTDKEGKVSMKPLTAQEMTQINNLIRDAVGYNAQRGDSVNVMNAAFNVPEDVTPPLWKDPEMLALAKEYGRYLLIVLLVMLLFFKVFLPPLREIFAPPPPPEPEPTEEEVGELSSEEQAAQTAQNSYDENLRMAKELAKTEPRIVASVVREWLGG